jgi:predicted ester cyclase
MSMSFDSAQGRIVGYPLALASASNGDHVVEGIDGAHDPAAAPWNRPVRTAKERHVVAGASREELDGREWDYQGLKGYFAALRAAFDGLRITRGIVIIEGNYVACQTSITGTFVREFTHTPVGALPPTGNPVVFDLINIFRYDDDGRLAEEWIQTDSRSVLRQLGAEGR